VLEWAALETAPPTPIFTRAFVRARLDTPGFARYSYPMAVVVFDTLALARKLEAAGFPPKQAQDTAAAFSDAVSETVASRRDLGETEIRLRRDITELEGRLRSDMIAMEQRLTIRLGAMLAGAVVIVAALVKLL
jgi:hypothetical protein